MKAMVLKKITSIKDSTKPLQLLDLPVPEPKADELLIQIDACGVCHTELDEIEGRTPPTHFPVIPGHQVVGRVIKTGEKKSRFSNGDRVGVAWFFSSCGCCKFCMSERENLCEHFKATGRDVDGGYAEYMKVPEKSVFRIPDIFTSSEAAPLLCAGAIGYRSLNLTGFRDGQNLGLTGFGASGHIVLQIAQFQFPKSKIYVFARSASERKFASELGAVWVGDTTCRSPEKLDAIIDTTPVWKPVVEALINLEKGGRLVVNAIRKEEIDKQYLLNLKYETHLWLEKEIKSVANITRKDVEQFLAIAAKIPIRPVFQEFPLEEANQALMELKSRKIHGAKVLKIGQN